jgi:peptidoglycan/LPS O-acetylase OafA/YrhL
VSFDVVVLDVLETLPRWLAGVVWSVGACCWSALCAMAAPVPIRHASAIAAERWFRFIGFISY